MVDLGYSGGREVGDIVNDGGDVLVENSTVAHNFDVGAGVSHRVGEDNLPGKAHYPVLSGSPVIKCRQCFHISSEGSIG
jgi:hypothetical protein